MRIPTVVVAVAALAPLLLLTGCGGAGDLPQGESTQSTSTQSTSTSSSAPNTSAANASSSSKPTPAPVGNLHSVPADPRPASPRSTGLIPVTTWKGTPAASYVYVDDKEIVSYAAGGHLLGRWELPGNLPAIVAGLTTAFGHSPLAQVNGTAGWKYTWDGFIIYDDTPEVVGPTDPAYQWDVSVGQVDGVPVYTVDHIAVGVSGDVAASIADVSSDPGFYVAELAPVPLSVPTTGSPKLWVEVLGGATVHDPITEMRGPVASWLS
jgi:hypothetical protein